MGKLFINNVEEKTFYITEYCYYCDFNFMYESELIYKNSTIRIEIYSNNLMFICGERSIEEYLKQPICFGEQIPVRTYLETVPIWKDEYELSPIDDTFLAKPSPKTNLKVHRRNKVDRRKVHHRNKSVNT